MMHTSATVTDINNLLHEKTGGPHHLFHQDAVAWSIDLADDKVWVLSCDPHSADVTLHYYNRPLERNPDLLLEATWSKDVSIDVLFRELNAQAGPLGFELYRVAGSRLILRDLSKSNDWYEIDLTYKIEDGYHAIDTCTVQRIVNTEAASIRNERTEHVIDYDF